MEQSLRLSLAQIAPSWLDRRATLDRVLSATREAAGQGAELVVFGEALLPGYPFWVELTDGARFNSKVQKELYAHYAREAVQIERGDLAELCQLAAQRQIAICLGIVERPLDRGGHSLYCSLVYIDPKGQIAPVHRKLQPTYEERLVWAAGDGYGLRTHPLKGFRVGGLNCWENWMPLSRAALYGQGVNLHVAVWPGNVRNTEDLTRFIALESRGYVASVSGVLRKEQIPPDFPYRDLLLERAPEVLANGGSCVAAPDGSWLLPPVRDEEGVFTCDLDLNRVLEERQNFDAAGHYARPDVTRLVVDQGRQGLIDRSEE